MIAPTCFGPFGPSSGSPGLPFVDIGINVKELNCWKTICHFAPDKNNGKHINFSTNIGVTWRHNIMTTICTT